MGGYYVNMALIIKNKNRPNTPFIKLVHQSALLEIVMNKTHKIYGTHLR